MADLDPTPQNLSAPEVPELKPAFEPKSPNKNLKIFGFITAGGFAFFCLVCIVFLLYQFFAKSATITALTADNQAAQAQIATMATRQAETDEELTGTRTELETTQKDLTDTQAELKDKKEQITDLNSKVSKLTLEKSNLNRAYNDMFCDTTLPKEKIASITDNEQLGELIVEVFEKVLGKNTVSSEYRLLLTNHRTALFTISFSGVKTLLFSIWDESKESIYSVYSIDGGCYFYKNDYIPEDSAPNG